MKMKKYTAPSISEAMKLVRSELGDDAVIINSKVIVTKKLFGLIKHKNFEVLAGVDHVETRTTSPRLPDLQVMTSRYKELEQKPKVHSDETITNELKSELAD